MYNIFHSILVSLTKEEQLTFLSNLYHPCGKAFFKAAAPCFYIVWNKGPNFIFIKNFVKKYI